MVGGPPGMYAYRINGIGLHNNFFGTKQPVSWYVNYGVLSHEIMGVKIVDIHAVSL